MKILVNGYHFGNNTPPYVVKFRSLGHSTRLITAAAFGISDLLRQHALSSELIMDDLVQPTYGQIERWAVYLLRKARIPVWRMIQARKVARVIAEFRPDVVWNHSLWIDTDVMALTGFHPQVTAPYGYNEVELHPGRKRIRRIIYENSDGFIDALPDFREFFIKHEGVPESKFPPETIYHGLPNLQDLLRVRVEDGRNLRIRYGISPDKIVLIETRGLRQLDGGSLDAIRAVAQLRARGLPVFLILTAGILGSGQVVRRAKDLISTLGISDSVRLVEEELGYESVIAHYAAADVFLSLLPSDALGKSIMEAIAQRCLLVLSDFRDYRTAFGSMAEYVRPGDVAAIAAAIERLICLQSEERKQRLTATRTWLELHQDFDKACDQILQYFAVVVEKHRQHQHKGIAE